MDKALYQVSLKVILKNEEGKVLVLKAQSDAVLRGSYDFPGGRIDEGQRDFPIEETIKREFNEELGDIRYELVYKPVAVGRHSLPNPNIPEETVYIFYIFFEAKFLGGDINISDEHSEFGWIDLENINLEENFRSGILEAVKMYLGK